MGDADRQSCGSETPACKPGREALSAEKRNQILAGAARIFARDGYEGASVSSIAASAEVSKGTLYNYFDSKAAMFAAYVEAECQSKLGHVFEGLEHATDIPAVLTELGQRMQYVMFSPTGLTIYRMVVSESGKFPELAQAFYEAGPRRAIRTMANWLAQQTQQGRLQVDDPIFAAEQFYALCRTRYGLQRELQLIKEPPPGGIEHVVEQAVTMFLRFYAKA